MKKIVLFTSNELRHKYFMFKIVEAFGECVVKIYSEAKEYVARDIGKNEEENEILNWHFNLRDKMEKKYFIFDPQIKFGHLIVECGIKGINKPEVIEELKESNPDLILVYGSSLIKNEIIELFPNRIINLHLGLSPYYRGSGTDFWPIYNEELQYVGATIHYLNAGIDLGDIIKHGVPEIKQDDNQHSIGCKAIITGIEKMISVAQDILLGKKIESVKIWGKGKLYLRKDFTSQTLIKFKKKLEQGLIKKYLSQNIEKPKLIL